MAIKNRISLPHESVFPAGAFLQGAVEPVTDFNKPPREDGTREQQRDKETNELMWQVVVVDADPEASKRDVAVTVKFAAPQQPVPPKSESAMPWTPVEFEGLSALAYIDTNGLRPRIAWSFRAEGMKAPRAQARPTNKEAA